MNHGSLFSGGGGFDLAADLMGWKNVFHCEKDTFCQSILKHYWPDANSYSDIKEFTATTYRGKIDVLTGGFPCQPFSNAGKRRGTADNRYLWPEMLRVIREVEAPWVVGENVYGLVNWNDGLVFDQVLSDLEAQGYEVQPYLLPAAGVSAPHQRYRIWIVAYHSGFAAKREEEAGSYANGVRWHQPHSGGQAAQGRERPECEFSNGLYSPELEEARSYAYGDGRDGLHRKNAQHASEAWQHAQCHLKQMGDNVAIQYHETENQQSGYWHNWPAQSALCGRDDGLPTELDGIAVSKWQTQSVKVFGNAIVPQVAVQLFKAIQAHNVLMQCRCSPHAM